MSAMGVLVFYNLYVMSAHPELIVSIPLVNGSQCGNFIKRVPF